MFQQGFSHRNSGKAGFLFEADFGGQLITSDETWKVKRNKAYLNDPDPRGRPNYRMPEPNIYYDGRLDMGEWYLPGYDDSSWDNAVTLGEAGCAPWNELILRIVPQLKNYGLTSYLNPEEFAPYTETATTEKVTLDMELAYNAQLTSYLKVEAPAGLEISMKTDNYSDPAGNGNTTMSSYVTKEGVQEFEAYGWMNGQHVYYEIPAGVKVLDLRYRETGYNTEFTGSFTSDDWFFDKLWQQSVRTLYVTMRDNFMDCPDRERAQWWGDVNNEMQMMMYSLDEQSYLLYKKGVDVMVGWQKSNGAMLTVCPTGNSNSELPLQNLAGIDGFWEYYLYTGDRDLIETAYNLAKDNMELFKMGGNGLVVHYSGTWDWPDWGSHADMSPLENAWYVMALQSCIDMATVLGYTEDIPGYQMKLESIRASYDANFWKGDYYYNSTGNGKPDDRANAMAVLSGLASKDKYPAIKEILVNTKNSSPYMEKYVLDALCEMGYIEEAQARIKDRYYNMTANPDTAYSTLWEFWDKNAGTKNHAWTGGPLITMSKYMAGVRPTTPGYDTYEIAPDLGILNTVNCVVPAVKGDIDVNINRDQDAKTLSMEVTSPVYTVATVGVPRFDMENTEVKLDGETLFVNGAAAGSADGVVYAGNDAEYIYFEVQPGTYSFTAEAAQAAPADSYTVHFDANEGGKILVNGEAVATPASKTFAAGDEVTVTAVPDANKAFYGWSGSFGSEEKNVSFKVNAPMNVTAEFGEKLYKEYTSITVADSNNTALQVKVNGAIVNPAHQARPRKGDRGDS